MSERTTKKNRQHAEERKNTMSLELNADLPMLDIKAEPVTSDELGSMAFMLQRNLAQGTFDENDADHIQATIRALETAQQGSQVSLGQWLAPVVARGEGVDEVKSFQCFALGRRLERGGMVKLRADDVSLIKKIVGANKQHVRWVKDLVIGILDPNSIEGEMEREVLEEITGEMHRLWREERGSASDGDGAVAHAAGPP